MKIKSISITLLIIVLSAFILSGCGTDKSADVYDKVTELLYKWAEPQSEEIIEDFYDGWGVIGEDAENKPIEKDIDAALDEMYGEYFDEAGWTYFQTFMLPVTIAATENDFTISAENIEVEELADGYDVTFDLKHYKGEDKDKVATVNSLSFRCYFKDGKICKIDFSNGMITPQFFVK